MNKKSKIENRSSKIWHLTDGEHAARFEITDARCPMPDFKTPNL
jgi:hypothetical protein